MSDLTLETYPPLLLYRGSEIRSLMMPQDILCPNQAVERKVQDLTWAC